VKKGKHRSYVSITGPDGSWGSCVSQESLRRDYLVGGLGALLGRYLVDVNQL
jgi:hypothetical protein